MNSQRTLEVPSENVLPQEDMAFSEDDDSDSSPPERPSTLPLDPNNVVYSHDSNDETGENDSLDREESHRSRSSSVGRTGKFRLRDISPARLRHRHKSHTKTDKEEKTSPSSKKNVRSSNTSWLPASFQQMFPSYKSKAGDFKRLFKDVPEAERLITDYSCALQRDILVHGRLYVSQSWLCFYANIFGWETLVTIPLGHVTSMTKEKTALVIPNAIQVWTESEKYFFTSFVSRDSTFRSLYIVWQNVLSDEPEQATALMKAVGKYVDVDSEDVDNSSRGSNEDLPSDFDELIGDEEIDDESLIDSEEPYSNDSPKETTTSIVREDPDKLTEPLVNGHDVPGIALSPASPAEVEKRDPNSPEATTKRPNGTVIQRKSTGTPESRRKFPFPFKKELSPLSRRKKAPQAKKRAARDKITISHRDSLMEDGSLSESNDSDSAGPATCPCDNHFTLQCINEEYATDIDTMYEYLFTDCDFYRSMRAARKDFDLDIDPWVDGDKKRRSVKYTINLNLAIGPKTSRIQENQELEASEPGQYYVVESNVINEGIPYSDSFVIVQRYCLTRISSVMCRLRVTAMVKYTRPVWGFVKTIISRNATDGLSSFFDFLKAFIREAEEQSTFGTRRRLPSSRKRQQNDNLEETLAKIAETRDMTGEGTSSSSGGFGRRISSLTRNLWSGDSLFPSIFTLLLIILLVLNIYLSYRVMSLERSTRSWEALALPSLPSEWPSDLEEFRNILYKQEYVHSIQLKRWQQVLSTSMQFLQQIQESLKQLQDEVDSPG